MNARTALTNELTKTLPAGFVLFQDVNTIGIYIGSHYNYDAPYYMNANPKTREVLLTDSTGMQWCIAPAGEFSGRGWHARLAARVVSAINERK